MPEEMKDQPEAIVKLIALLDDHREELADAWLEIILREMPDARYSQRPAKEIRANNLNALTMLRDLLHGRAPNTIWERRADATLLSEYVDLGIDVSEVVMAALLLGCPE